MIFYDTKPSQIANLRAILARFEELSGLYINLGKSELVPVGGVHNLEALVGLLGCGQSSLPLKYLGLPLGAKFKDSTVWNHILERMERRLSGWKRLYLSKGGKVTLIKSSLSSLPTYFLSLLPLPGKVAKRMEKSQRDFLWNGIGGELKIHLVKWAKVCKPLQVGGLGIKHLGSFNSALLGKWLWRYGMETNALYMRVIEANYGNILGCWCTKKVTILEACVVKFWKHLWLKLWVGLLGDFTGMCNFIIHHKIGKKKPLISLWGWSILRQCGGLAQIRFVGSLQGTKVLRLKDIIAPSTLLLLFHSHRE